jgi:aminoglycoside phosphotransferase (APT) family kinase protein
VRSWELQGGVSAQMTAFEVERADGSRETLVLRRHGAADLARNPNIAADELRLLRILEATGIPAPVPRGIDDGELVLGYIEGDPPAAGEPELLEQLASALAGIHRAEGDFSFLPDRRLADVSPRPSVLLHGDYWQGNTLWRDGRLVAVIDWEDAAFGDPLADLANARLELLWWLGCKAMDDFTERYASLRGAFEPAALARWDLWVDVRVSRHIANWGLDDATLNAMNTAREAFAAAARRRIATQDP